MSVRIPGIDRACTDPQWLPCVVVQVMGKPQVMYRLQFEAGVLYYFYRAYQILNHMPVHTISPLIAGENSHRSPLGRQPGSRHHGMCSKGTNATAVQAPVTAENVAVVKRDRLQ